jgi:hypothetical protein
MPLGGALPPPHTLRLQQAVQSCYSWLLSQGGELSLGTKVVVTLPQVWCITRTGQRLEGGGG